MRQITIQNNFKNLLGSSLLYFILITIFTTSVNAQHGATPLSLAKGRSANSYQISDVENIDYFTGRVNISIPLAGIQGRGETGYSLSANLNHPFWKTRIEYNYTGNPDGTPYLAPEGEGMLGTITGLLSVTSRMTVGYSNTTLCPGNTYRQHTITRIYVTTGDGAEHELRDTLTDGQALSMANCTTYPNRGKVFVSKDGSDLMYVSDTDIYDDGIGLVNGGYLIFKNGMILRVADANGIIKLVDRNGNFTSFTGGTENGALFNRITDSIGREASMYPIYWVDSASPASVKYKGVGGQQRQTIVKGAMLHDVLVPGETIKTSIQLFGVSPDSYNSPVDGIVMSEIVLPNGQKYSFKYNSYGEIARIEFPTGSAVEYTWAPGVDGIGTDGVSGPQSGGLNNDLGNPYIYRRVIERRQYDDGINLTRKTTISRPESYINPNTNSNQGYVDVKTYTPQLATFERHYYYGQASANFQYGGGYTPWKTGKEYRTEILSPQDSSVLRATEQTWQQTNPSWCSGCGDYAPVNNPKIVETITTLGDSNQVSKKTFAYDNYNNLTDTYEYDYGIGAPGQFLRRSHTDYLTTNPINNINYTSNNIHILDLAAQTWVSSDAAGNNKVSLTKFEYDNYTTDQNHASLVNRSNITGHDSNYGTNYSPRGNLTKVTSYINAQNEAAGAISIYTQYDIAGNVVKTIDGEGYISTVDYTDRFGLPDAEARGNSAPSQLNGQQTFAFATSATNAIGFTAYTQYDYYTGVEVDSEDINGTVDSTYYNNDLLDRPTQTISANNRPQFKQQTTFNYYDTQNRVETTSDLNAFNDNLIKSESFYDKMGRTTETRSYKDGDYVVVKTQYDAFGRVKQVTSPYRPLRSEQELWTITKYDDLGRVTETETPNGETTGGAKVLTSYSGNRTLITDQAGKQRINKTNAIEQLTDVWEITSQDAETVSVSFPNHPEITHGYQTSYQYDPLNNVKVVNQGQQSRNFTYDSLSRLKTRENPESGIISYQYDDNGNLTEKTDARGVKTTYIYDTINRVISKSYTAPQNLSNYLAAQAVTYSYDNLPNAKGELIKVITGNDAENPFSVTEYTEFDQVGRVKKSKQRTDNMVIDEMTYTYNLAGALVEQKYPSGRVVKNVLDSDGDLSKIQSKRTENAPFWNYAQNFNYTASGAVSLMQLGNGRWESTQFNNRLQTKQIALGSSQNATNILKINYEYGRLNLGTGNPDPNTNNGNIAKQTITVPTVGANQGFSATQYYTYDNLNRLQIVSENYTPNGQQMYNSWKQTFKYDRHGNRNFVEADTTTLTRLCPNSTICTNDRNKENPEIDPLNNRIKEHQDSDNVKDYEYDLAGNIKRDADGRTFTYDSEDKQVKVESNNQLIGEYWYDGDGRRVKKKTYGQITEETIFIYDALGKLVAEYSNQPSNNPQVSYMTTDTLGSPRIITDKNGHVSARHDFRPFGEEITRANYGADDVRKKFTGYERDKESDLDFAQARYYSSKIGRFYSVDPENYGASEDDPQSWNAYSYARNNPTTFTDPDGLDVDYCDNKDGGGCVHLTQDEERTLFDKEYQRSLGNTVANGLVRNSDGDIIARYKNNDPMWILVNGAGPKLDIWQPIIEELGLNIITLPVGGLGNVFRAANYGSKIFNTTRRALPILQRLCFVAGTPVMTENGLKPIEEIKEGDKVLSYNEKTKQTEYKTVAQTMVRVAEAGRILSVKVEGEAEALGVTGEHPFYVRIHKARDNTASEDDEGEWIEAKDLRIGNEIRKADGSWAKVESVTQRSEGAKVYNFEVTDNHNYFVGQTSLLAHNSCVELTRAGTRAIGNLAKHKDELVRVVQRARGGNAGAWNAIDTIENGVDYSRLTLGEVANAAGQGVEAAKRVLKQVKDAARLAGKN
jgi:RHS repeat-associated protein